MCVKREWLEHILSGRKTVELRTQTLRHKLAAASEAGKWLVVGLINDQTMYGVARFTTTKHLGAAAWSSEQMQHNSALDTLPEHERIAYKAGHWDHAWGISDVLRFPTPVAVGVSSQTWATVPSDCKKDIAEQIALALHSLPSCS